MPAQFEDGGIRFQYPENWRLEREDNEAGWTVSLYSPETAFVMVCLREDMPSTDRLADAALDALREEYPDLEADACVDFEGCLVFSSKLVQLEPRLRKREGYAAQSRIFKTEAKTS